MKEKYLEALRSGEYEQTKYYLRWGTSYCAVGLALEVYREETGKGEWVIDEEDPNEYKFVGESPERVLSKMGIRTSPSRLMTLNDAMGLPFDKIASRIEWEG